MAQGEDLLDRFLDDVILLHPSSFVTFSFVAKVLPDRICVLQSRLVFSPRVRTDLASFSHGNIIAGRFTTEQLGHSPKSLMTSLLNSGLETPLGQLKFSLARHHPLQPKLQPYHPEALQSHSRVSTLTILGVEVGSMIPQPSTDWELKAAPVPFESLQELMRHFEVGDVGSRTDLQIIALNSVEVDLSQEVNGTTASIGILMANGLESDKATLGYRTISQGIVVDRRRVGGQEMQWMNSETHRKGLATIQVPNASVIHCIASYDGVAQHEGWIADPAHSQNPRRTVYQTFDTDLEVVRDYLNRGTRGNARDLEDGVAWLSWMLGFGVARLGDNPKMTDAPDLLITSARGDLALIECTTALLKSDKIAALVSRAGQVRRRLNNSGYTHQSVIPVMVTSKSRHDVRADLNHAARNEVLVLCKEDLDDALTQTLMVPNSDKLYHQALVAIAEAKSKAEERTEK